MEEDRKYIERLLEIAAQDQKVLVPNRVKKVDSNARKKERRQVKDNANYKIISQWIDERNLKPGNCKVYTGDLFLDFQLWAKEKEISYSFKKHTFARLINRAALFFKGRDKQNSYYLLNRYFLTERNYQAELKRLSWHEKRQKKKQSEETQKT